MILGKATTIKQLKYERGYTRMMSDKEQSCIKHARQARLSAAKARLAELRKDGVQFEGPGIRLTGGIEWKESIGGRIQQIALIPLFLVFVLIEYAMTPIIYILNLLNTHQKRKELEREINKLETELLSDQVPDEKDLESLWWLHGLEERKYLSDERLSLLGGWIDILYGEDVSKDLRLQSRVEESRQRQMKANMPYYEGKDLPHYHFASPVDSLIRALSKELPEYE